MRLPVAALILCAAMLGATPLAAAPPQTASCQITAGGQRIDGPCLFTPRKGGSFDLRMQDGRRIDGAATVSLDVTGPGRGTLSGSGGHGWGDATRQADGACWSAQDLTVCVRAAKGAPAAPQPTAPNAAGPVPEPSAADRARSFGARCHMGGCSWFIQGTPRETGRGSDAVPGRRVEVEERSAYSEHPGDYPDHAPAGLKWDRVTLQLFCSTMRPAFRDDDGRWIVLPLPEVFGATEGITTRYLKGCHPGWGDDPYKGLEALGYRKRPQGPDSYPDFKALISR